MRLKGRRFFIEQEEVDINLIKSRNPSAYITISSQNRYLAPGVDGIEIYLPLSPNLCLYLCDRQDGFRPLKTEKINKLTIMQSNKYIFSKYEKFDFIERIIKKHPEYVDKTGKRSIVRSVILDKNSIKKKNRIKFEALKPYR